MDAEYFLKRLLNMKQKFFYYELAIFTVNLYFRRNKIMYSRHSSFAQ